MKHRLPPGRDGSICLYVVRSLKTYFTGAFLYEREDFKCLIPQRRSSAAPPPEVCPAAERFRARAVQWILLLLAGLAEITWAVAMKYAEGFTKLVPSVVTIVFYILSAVFLSASLKKLPLGTAYAMWTGFGIVGTSLLGALLFKETMSLPQIVCVAMIVCGIVGLKVL